MTLEARIESLKAKHADLETAILMESRRAFPDESTIHNLKRKKLKIKDELERILHS